MMLSKSCVFKSCVFETSLPERKYSEVNICKLQYFILTIHRYQYYIMIGGAILIGKLGASDFRLGFIMVMFISVRFYQFLHFDRVFNMRLTQRMHNEFMDPVYGLGRIILNYDNLYNFNF